MSLIRAGWSYHGWSFLLLARGILLGYQRARQSVVCPCLRGAARNADLLTLVDLPILRACGETRHAEFPRDRRRRDSRLRPHSVWRPCRHRYHLVAECQDVPNRARLAQLVAARQRRTCASFASQLFIFVDLTLTFERRC